MRLSEDRVKFLFEHAVFSKHLLACARELQRGTERLDRGVDLGVFPGTLQGVVAIHGGPYRSYHFPLLVRALANAPLRSVYLCAKTGTSRTVGDDRISTESEAIISEICSRSFDGSVSTETFLMDPKATNTGMEVRMMREIQNFSCRALCSKWHARRVMLTWQHEAPHIDVRIVRVHTKEDDLLNYDDVDPILRECWKNLLYPSRGFQSAIPEAEVEMYREMFSALLKIAPDVHRWIEQEVP